MAPDEPRRSTAEILALAGELAPLLGPGWSAVPDPYGHQGSACLRRPDGAEFALYQERWPPAARGRLVAAGRYPRSDDGRAGGHGEGKAPRITVDIARPARAIAGDIARRFLPAYLEAFAVSRAEVEAWRDGKDAAEVTAHRIGQAAGVEPHRWPAGGQETWCVPLPGGSMLVSGTFDEPIIRLEMHHLDAKSAKRIARIFSPWKKVRPA
jgi:hypothetical protein